jgi:hypothetical protein
MIVQGDGLVELYVQLKRLHASLRLADVVVALQETLVNLVGSEDFAIFLRETDGGRFERLTGIGTRAAAVEAFTPETPPSDAVALVPLRSGFGDATPMGMVAICGLVAHKRDLSEHDHALLRELGDHAGIALEAALAVEIAGRPRVDVRELRTRLGSQIQLDLTVTLAGSDEVRR